MKKFIFVALSLVMLIGLMLPAAPVSASAGSIATLRPVADGTYLTNQLWNSEWYSGDNWSFVNDSNDSSYVFVQPYYTEPDVPQTDFYAFSPPSSLVGTIYSITAYMRVYRDSAPLGFSSDPSAGLAIFLKGGSSSIFESAITPSSTAENYNSPTYYGNPFNGQPWTWADLANLEIGVQLQAGVYNDGESDSIVLTNCTEVWVEVYYAAIAPQVLTHPEDRILTSSGSVSFSSTANGIPAPTVKWQVNSGSGFTDVSDNAIYSGSTNTTLHITNPPASVNGHKYQAVFTNGVAPDAISNEATLHICYPSASSRYLDSDPNISATLIMEQSGSQSGSQDLGAFGSLYWLSSHSAATEVTFPEDTWTVCLKFQNDGDWITESTLEDTISPRIGVWDPDAEPGSEFTQAQYYETAESSFFDPGAGIYCVELLSGDLSEPITVPEGQYLCLAVFNDGTPYQIITDGDSRLDPPADSPNFPVPELAAGILLAVGLAGIGGFIVIKRKKPLKTS